MESISSQLKTMTTGKNKMCMAYILCSVIRFKTNDDSNFVEVEEKLVHYDLRQFSLERKRKK